MVINENIWSDWGWLWEGSKGLFEKRIVGWWVEYIIIGVKKFK